MKCALAVVGFINEDIEYNKAVLAEVPSRFMRKFICRLRLNEVSRQ